LLAEVTEMGVHECEGLLRGQAVYQAGLALRLRLQVVEQTVIETAARCLNAEHAGSRDEEGGAACSAPLQKFATVHGISDLIR
jgi:hypothetical protein